MLRPSLAVRLFPGCGVGPGAMDGARGVLGGRVDRVQPKIIRPDVDEVVSGARRHVDEPACPDAAAIAVQDRLAFAGGENEDLVVAFITEHAMKRGYDYGDEFEYGLDLILNGIERVRSDRGDA